MLASGRAFRQRHRVARLPCRVASRRVEVDLLHPVSVLSAGSSVSSFKFNDHHSRQLFTLSSLAPLGFGMLAFAMLAVLSLLVSHAQAHKTITVPDPRQLYTIISSVPICRSNSTSRISQSAADTTGSGTLPPSLSINVRPCSLVLCALSCFRVLAAVLSVCILYFSSYHTFCVRTSSRCILYSRTLPAHARILQGFR